ncbi:UDP-N-acetylglucosamine 2-epimerase [Bacteroides ndongoniae]|uniref:UDP-N-acetylglucosamine 2-epimerase n=1 Tax=Bacteroides ndongoniae TaxID=1903262 RepID=UPI0008DA2F50|nr:UDP-N-acetylglucosamine 2-epimerase [Bacteroides ndongoniae]
MRKICIVTGSRAEYGLLSGLMHAINDEPTLQLQIIATNMHLSPEFGLTYKEIEHDGFHIDKKVQMLLSSDTPNATTKSVGLAAIGFADAYEDLQPDLIVVLGDRFEILAAVTAALFFKIPVAHLHGGEITEGAYDDCIRHAITKMSHLHFTSTEVYRQRVIQMGEQPDRVYYVGAIGVENIKKVALLSQKLLEESIHFVLGDKSLLVTYHPVTLENNTASVQCQNLLDALDDFSDYKVIFTLPNSDTDGRIIIQMINEYVSQHSDRCMSIPSLGLKRYLSALQYVTAVVGNSSSGIIEVPSFGIPTLNIGNRQKGRIAAPSVINCGTSKQNIIDGLNKVLSNEQRSIAKDCLNPYDKENTIEYIIEVLKNVPLRHLINKSFYNL